jgi:hypothetical protein
MRRIGKWELRFALVATGILVILATTRGDFVMAIIFATVAALGTIWQVRHAAIRPRRKSGSPIHSQARIAALSMIQSSSLILPLSTASSALAPGNPVSPVTMSINLCPKTVQCVQVRSYWAPKPELG